MLNIVQNFFDNIITQHYIQGIICSVWPSSPTPQIRLKIQLQNSVPVKLNDNNLTFSSLLPTQTQVYLEIYIRVHESDKHILMRTHQHKFMDVIRNNNYIFREESNTMKKDFT